MSPFVSSITDEGLDEEEIAAAVSAYKQQKKFNFQPKKTEFQLKNCTYCGYGHNKKQPCPAKEKYCLKCGMKGHFSRVCRTSSNGKERSSKSSSSVMFVNIICANVSDSLPRLSVLVGEDFSPVSAQFQVIPDTGAEVTVAGETFLDQLNIKRSRLNQPQHNLKHVAGGDISVIGSCKLSFKVLGQTIVEEVYFVPNISAIFLSLTGCRGLKLIHSNFPDVIDNRINAVEVKQDHIILDHSDSTQLQSKARVTIGDVEVPDRPRDVAVPDRPQSLPLEPIEENLEQLENWLLKTFSTVFDTEVYPLRVMSGKPQHIHLKRDAIPYAVHSPIPVPCHWSEEVKKILDRDVQLGILEKVPVGQPVEWCTRMVTVKKKDGSPRITIDYQHLNKDCLRETHPNDYPFNIVSNIPLYTYKTVADAFQGYHQVLLDNDSSALTTFITEHGRYRYLRTPQGLCSAGDAYTHRYSEILVDIQRKYRLVDDTLLYDTSIEDAFFHTFDFLVICAANGVTLNPAKFKFARKEVNFVGYTLGWDKYTPSKDTLSAISEFPMPSKPSISDIRAWFGLVNQLSPFLATSPIMEPFRELLKPSVSKGKQVHWDTNLQDIFEKSKYVICEEASKGLAYFDTTKNVIVITDWSTKGIAFTILQQHCTCDTKDDPFCCLGGWKLVLCSSRHLQDAERNYAPIEGEALAIAWSLRKARNFLLGCPNFVLLTDHKPLVNIFSNKALSSISNPRLMRMKQQTLQYTFTIKHLDGKDMFATDTLSRYPAKSPDDEDKNFHNYLEIASITVASLCASESLSATLSEVSEVASSDSQYKILLEQVRGNTFAASKKDENNLTKPFYHVKDRLSIVDGLLMYSFDGGDLRLVIPVQLQAKVINNLHSAHQGSDPILKRARQCVYWPGMGKAIIQSCEQCESCIKNARSQTKEELILSPVPQYPFQHVVADIFHSNGYEYLVYADRLTGWIEVAYFKVTPKSCDIIDAIRDIFHRFGVPEEISLDGGPNISSTEITNFLKKWGTSLRQSSAFYPQSNGRAEAAVKTMKRVICGNTSKNGSINNDNIARALLQYRNTPLQGVKTSPAQLLLGRKLRDTVPQPSSGFRVSPQWQFFIRQREKAMLEANSRMKEIHDEGSVKKYDALSVGTFVVCQNTRNRKWDRKGIIVEVCNFRQYKIKMEGSGRISMRNRIHIRPLLNVKPHLPRYTLPPTTHEAVETPQSFPSSVSEAIVMPPHSVLSGVRPVDTQELRRSKREAKVPDRYGEWTT